MHFLHKVFVPFILASNIIVTLSTETELSKRCCPMPECFCQKFIPIIQCFHCFEQKRRFKNVPFCYGQGTRSFCAQKHHYRGERRFPPPNLKESVLILEMWLSRQFFLMQLLKLAQSHWKLRAVKQLVETQWLPDEFADFRKKVPCHWGKDGPFFSAAL